MTVVLDCNILVMCLTSRSPYHIIYKALVAGGFSLAVTTDILFEYEEIIQQKYGTLTANSFLALLNELPNVVRVTAYYRWQLLAVDEDDNKYCDCAIASNADCIITEDKHFQNLKTIPFPQIKTLSIDEFAGML